MDGWVVWYGMDEMRGMDEIVFCAVCKGFL